MFRGRVLVADDDFLLLRQVVLVLERDRFYVDFCTDGLTALNKLQSPANDFDAAVLDINMPGMTGLQILEALRTSGSQLPVLLLTDLTGEADTVFGFDAGADDYVGKPFRARELAARVGRMVRSAPEAEAPTSVGQGLFDLHGLRMVGPKGEGRLSVTERKLLKPLLSPVGRLVPQGELLAAGWGSSDRRNLRSLYEHVRRIRSRMDELDTGVDIRVIRGVGYRLEEA